MLSKYIAAIDMGTNSFHLVVAELKKKDSFKIIDREREIIRLGSHKGEVLNLISKEEISKSIEVIRRFKQLASYYNAPVRAVATSAVREAFNRNDFITEVQENTGVHVEIIDGHKEANLIYIGAKKALEISDKRVLCIDIGGGSTEFVLGDNSHPVFAESVKIGAVRLSRKYFQGYILFSDHINECSSYIEDEIASNKNICLNEHIELAVGSSGTIQSVASMINYLRNGAMIKSMNGFSFTDEEFFKVAEIVLNKRTPRERLTIGGLEAKRADIIPAGVLILKKIFEMFKLKSMTVSEYALREGIILDMIANKDLYLK